MKTWKNAKQEKLKSGDTVYLILAEDGPGPYPNNDAGQRGALSLGFGTYSNKRWNRIRFSDEWGAEFEDANKEVRFYMRIPRCKQSTR
jgi:hypothetical protein